jgi:extracellular factor (EF) 3-hydroxypalmitic acid methyl ester biosynthesis protein
MDSSATRRSSRPPPGPSSEPVPLSTDRPRRFSSAPPPRHEDLAGASGNAVRFRPARLVASELPVSLTCRFRCEGAPIGPMPVLDLATTGFAARAQGDLALAPGSTLDSLEILLDGRAIWTGEAVVVHETMDRIGARFTSGVVDLRHVRVGATLDGRLSSLRTQRAQLPAEWRAAVSDLCLLLESARLEVDEFERVVPDDPLHRAEDEAELFGRLRARWGAAYYEAVAALHAQSKLLGEEAVQLARGYASSALMPILIACPLHRRAYEKPLGYAGDYRMMELYFARDLVGETLFGRFLHTIAQGYSLGRAVVAREALMRDAVRAAAESPGVGPVRVLSVAAGPALELRRLLREATSFRRPLQLVLLDQDEGALEIANRRLQRILVDALRDEASAPSVTVECLHFSVKQLLQPRTLAEAEVFEGTLSDLDLIYSAGLYDYLPEPVAKRLTRLLYTRLRPGGRLLMGNLSETPDSTWIMEYVLGWHLLYRTAESMLTLAEGLSPAPARVAVVHDATGRSLFLDVVSGEGAPASRGGAA